MGIRKDGREPDELRPVLFVRDFTEFAMGSVLVEFGRTRVLCTASVEDRVPPWLRGTRTRLGDGRVLDAARIHPRAFGPGSGARPSVGTHPGDPAPHRAVARARSRTSR